VSGAGGRLWREQSPLWLWGGGCLGLALFLVLRRGHAVAGLFGTHLFAVWLFGLGAIALAGATVGTVLSVSPLVTRAPVPTPVESWQGPVAPALAPADSELPGGSTSAVALRPAIAPHALADRIPPALSGAVRTGGTSAPDGYPSFAAAEPEGSAIGEREPPTMAKGPMEDAVPDTPGPRFGFALADPSHRLETAGPAASSTESGTAAREAVPAPVPALRLRVAASPIGEADRQERPGSPAPAPSELRPTLSAARLAEVPAPPAFLPFARTGPKQCARCQTALGAEPSSLFCRGCGRPLCADCYWGTTSAATRYLCPRCVGHGARVGP
jgi:hypothetical protein